MSQMTLSPTDTMTADVATEPKAFRIPNPLRAGAISFVATIAVAGGLLAVFDVALNRGMDAYYDQKLATLATVPNDPAYLKAAEVSKAVEAEDAAQASATVSAN